MKLFLLRHAETGSRNTEVLSEISDAGLASLKEVVDFLNEKGLMEVAEIRHSPWVSAIQTAQHFKQLTGISAELRVVPLLEPYADFRILADLVSSQEENLLLVGHQPNLGMLASYLLTQESNLSLINLKKAGLLCLERVEKASVRNNLRNAWQLRWMISPRILRKS
jgi:phosphohistidine phosphatase